MSLNLTKVDIGLQANDGTGDPIRSAFNTVNNNFLDISTTLNQGTIETISNAISVNSYQVTANVSTAQTLTVTGNSTFNNTIANNVTATNIQSGTITTTGNLNVGGQLNASQNVVINGNLTVIGTTTTINTVNTSITEALMSLHSQANAAPWTFDDGVDIGFAFNYYKTSAKTAALVWANDTQALEYYSDGVETAANVFVGMYGNIKAGNLIAVTDMTAGGTITSANIDAGKVTTGLTTTGNLTVTNKIVGSIYIGDVNDPYNLDTIYIKGVPVATALSSFNGGQVGNLAWFLGPLVANSQIASTSVTSGAIVVDGGVGINGNIYAGGIRNTPISGSTGDFTSLSVSSTFAASSVSFLGGFISNVYGNATQWVVTDFTSGNVKITGGTVTGLTSLGSSNVAITSGTITGLTNLTASSATITAGSMTGLSQVTTTNLTSTNGLLVPPGVASRIAGDFTNTAVANRLMFQTTITNGATSVSAVPRGSIAATALTSAYILEDANSVATGNGSIGSMEMFQGTEVRISASIRGTGTYLPMIIYTNGSKAAQFTTGHDFTVFNTTGTTGAVTLGANGVVSATSFTGSGSNLTNITGANVTGTVANATNATNLATARTINGVLFNGTANITVTAAASTLTGTSLATGVTTSSLTSVGIVTTGTWSGAFGAVSGANLTSITGANVTGAVTNSTNAATVPWTGVTDRPTTVSAFTNDSGYITAATLGTYGVSQIIAGTNIVISPAGGTGAVTINTTATANASLLTSSILSSNVTSSSLTSVGTLTSLATSGDLIVGGNFTVNGTTTTINATTLNVADLNITVAKDAANAAAANGAGLTVAGAGATFTYTSADDRWNVNKTINGTIANALAVPWAGISNPPTIPAAQVQTDWNASTGLGVLLNKPTIPAAQVQADWNATIGVASILNKPTLATVATSGSYADLNNKPTFLAGAKYTESTTAPGGPTAGDRWYNTASDILYQYIGSAWVDVFTAGVTATSTATANAIVQRDGSAGAAFNAISATTLTVSATTGIAATGTGTQNIGTSVNKFGTFYGLSTSAQYADLAEIYMADKNYVPGTVVVFGGRDEITANDRAYDSRIAGVVSTNPAYLMNDSKSGLQDNGSYAIPVALTGRVPCRVIGPIKKGDLLVASKFAGTAQAIDNAKWVPGCAIGKALADVPNVEITIIEVVIGRF